MPSTARRIVLPKPEQYLGAENDGECRHEFVRGAIHAMADVREGHGLIAGNTAANLKSALPITGRTFALDMKLDIGKSTDEHDYSPDVFVTCSQTDRDRHVKVEPLLVVEVLAPHTARTERERNSQHASSVRLPRDPYSPGRVSGASRSSAGVPTGNARLSRLKLRSCWNPSVTP